MPSTPQPRSAVPLVLALLVASCGGPDASAGGADESARSVDAGGDAEPQIASGGSTLGTIRATVDGREVTWYAVSGPSRGRPYSSGAWNEFSPGEWGVSLGGFETADPPMDSFERGADGTPIDLGEYEGSVISLLVSFTGEPSPVTIRFPATGSGANAVMYMPVAEIGNMDVTYILEEGVLDVTRVEIRDGRARMEGTFSGTLRTMAGETVEIANGRFEAAGLPRLDELSG